MVELLAPLLDVALRFLELELLLAAVEGVGHQQFAVEGADLLGVLEELGVGPAQLLLLAHLLQEAFLFVGGPALEFLLLELGEPFLLLPLLEVLGVVSPVVGTLLAGQMQLRLSLLRGVR